MNWYTGLIQFNDHPDGDTQTPELIHVQANSVQEARTKVVEEHKRQVFAKIRGETWTDPDEIDPEYAEMEYEVFVPEGLREPYQYAHYGPELFFLFNGKLTNLY